MNRLFNEVKLAVRNLTLQKLRVMLTILGLIFGVSSVVVMLAIAEGASAEAQRQIAELGATNLIIQSIKPVEDANQTRQNNDSFVYRYGLTRQDFERIVDTIPTVVSATPLREFRKNVRRHEQELEARIVGCDPDIFKLTNQTIVEGRRLADLDLARYSNVAVIGHEVAQKLFPFGNPVGKTLRVVDGPYFQVVGVTGFKNPSGGTGSSLSSQDFNKDIYIPLTTDRARFGELIVNEKRGSFSAERIELSQITVKVDSMENVRRTDTAIRSLLKQTHPKMDYGVTVPLELLEKAEATKRIFNLVLGSIAGISLLVGGIGIMNIMLATVSERTREIGIRRALGARQRDITTQFLIETTVMSGSGGLIGVIVGIIVPPVIAHYSGMPAVIHPWSPILAFTIALATGLVFGTYPALRAARMDPVEALRSE